MEGLEALLVPGYELAPETPPIAAEAIGGAIYALIHDQVKRKGPERLPELAPMATYMTLGPVPRSRAGLRAGDGGVREMVSGRRRRAQYPPPPLTPPPPLGAEPLSSSALHSPPKAVTPLPFASPGSLSSTKV